MERNKKNAPNAIVGNGAKWHRLEDKSELPREHRPLIKSMVFIPVFNRMGTPERQASAAQDNIHKE